MCERRGEKERRGARDGRKRYKKKRYKRKITSTGRASSQKTEIVLVC